MLQDTLTRKYLEQIVRELGLHDEEEAIQYLAQLVARYGKKVSAVKAMNETVSRLENVVQRLERLEEKHEELEKTIAELCSSLEDVDIAWMKSLPQKKYAEKTIGKGRVKRLGEAGKIIEVLCRESA